MSLSRTDFYKQATAETRTRELYLQDKKSYEYYLTYGYDYTSFDSVKHAESIIKQKKITTTYNIHDVYVNHSLEHKKMVLTFDGVIVSLCGTEKSITRGDNVVLLPGDVVVVGERKHSNTRLGKIKRPAYINIVDDATVLQSPTNCTIHIQDIKLCSPTNITIES